MPGALAQSGIQSAMPSIEVADGAAAKGEWALAIAIWERLLDSPDHLAATRRIRWFLDESPDDDVRAGSGQKRGSTRKRMLLASLACTAIGTACVFLGQGTSGSNRILLATLAWVLYLATATLVVAYAFASGSSPATATSSLSAAELRRARQLATLQPATDRHRRPHV